MAHGTKRSLLFNVGLVKMVIFLLYMCREVEKKKRILVLFLENSSIALIQAIGDGLSSPKYPDFEVPIECTAYRVYKPGTVKDHVQIA